MMAKLGDICSIVSGTTPKSNRPEYWDGDINWVTPAELNDDSDIIYESQRKITEQAVQDSSLKPFPAGTVLLSSRAPIGKVAIAGVEMYCNQGFKNLICSNRIYNRYLYHFLKNSTEYLNSLGRGATFKEISKSIVENIEIPLPPLDEQRRIAAMLDKVSGLIAKRREQLDKLDELVKARFVEMFGDPIKNEKGFPTITGQDFFKLSNGKFVPENKRFDNGVPAYGGNGISWYTDEILYHNDTIVVGRVGFQSGNVHLAKGPLWITDNAMYISDYDSDKYDLRFLYALMEHINFTRFQDAGDLKKITQKPFMSMEYITPTLKQQQEYVVFVEQTEKSKLTIQQSLDKLEVLKKALIQQYFET
ncbi:restriction endonuclease subunit S [Flavonifractor sp. An100]|uniref:restriction endonuclease subunit S n=1 Tax=Flavonifractor sp. An100 TaxID=1965538 RepID=UPI000B39DBB5|nr:restriction endonuclease subunit S [Flavonifractor sp. An100]OUQ79796.1 hypothetical protein B5E43_05165 [Flavonifractor sp. An100]